MTAHSRSNSSVRLRDQVAAFLDEQVYPNENAWHAAVAANRWQPTAIMEQLKAKARAAGLWNLFLPESDRGAGLTNLEYAPLCELMGRSPIGAEPYCFT